MVYIISINICLILLPILYFFLFWWGFQVFSFSVFFSFFLTASVLPYERLNIIRFCQPARISQIKSALVCLGEVHMYVQTLPSENSYVPNSINFFYCLPVISKKKKKRKEEKASPSQHPRQTTQHFLFFIYFTTVIQSTFLCSYQPDITFKPTLQTLTNPSTATTTASLILTLNVTTHSLVFYIIPPKKIATLVTAVGFQYFYKKKY